MPLVTCPDCGNQISDRAPTCPQCGAPNDSIQTNTQAPSQVSSPPVQHVVRPSGTQCPQCTSTMKVGRRVLMSIAFILVAALALLISIPFAQNVIPAIQDPRYNIKWEIAGPMLIVPFFGLYLLFRGFRYFQPHLICPKCKKEVWK